MERMDIKMQGPTTREIINSLRKCASNDITNCGECILNNEFGTCESMLMHLAADRLEALEGRTTSVIVTPPARTAQTQDAGAGRFAAAVVSNALALIPVVYGVVRAAAWWLILPWLAMCLVHISCATYPPQERGDLHADE